MSTHFYAKKQRSPSSAGSGPASIAQGDGEIGESIQDVRTNSFVPFYAQRLSTACVLNGARAIQKSLKRKADRRRSATTAA